MSSFSNTSKPIDWKKVPNGELEWDKIDPENIWMVKLQEKYQCKRVWCHNHANPG
ncbi:hypothetical protein ID866_10199 [Astraeus odoratus]|nr:hypothetical protein ID866_10199 [Astraeus odoratus]